MNEFRESRSLCALRISGVRVVPDRRGPTPLSWQEALDGGRQDPEEAQLALLASCLGKVFAWPTIQRGRMAQNLIPVERHRAFQPRFDGTDRWLKRISVAGSPPSDLGAGTGTRARAL